MAEIYCFVDDYLKAHPTRARWRRSPNASPAFTDAEVITIALLQGSFGCATLKRAYELVRDNWRSAFPRLCSYKQWVARLHALCALVGQLTQAARASDAPAPALYLLDSKPVPVCKPIRHGRARLLREDGAYFGKGSAGWFFGFKLHLLSHLDGHIHGGLLLPANWNDRDAAPALALLTGGGVALGDLAYVSAPLGEALGEEADLLLITPKDAGRPKEPRRVLVSSLRERVETLFSSLWSAFVDRVYSRSWHGLWNTVKLKLLYYNLRQAELLSA